MSDIVQISDLDFSYGRQQVLCGVNLSVTAGKTLGVIGPNGGGKTTLVKLLMNQLKPARGTIRIDGLSPARAIARGDVIGYLPQNPVVSMRFPISVRQLVHLGLAGKTGMFHADSPDDLRFANELIARCGIDDIADQPIADVSGGQLQRAMIARALAPRPKLLILDEPTTGIDLRGQHGFVELIQKLKSDLELTIILVSHDLRAVTSMSDRVACLSMHLHYHDTPNHLPAELVYNMFSCDLAAMGVGDPHHTCVAHTGASGATSPEMAINRITFTPVKK